MGRYDTEGSNALAPNDPYKNMERSSHRPDFQVINGGKSNSDRSTGTSKPQLQVIDGGKSPQRASSTAAKDSLRNAEKSALSNEKSFFTGSGKNNKNSKGNKSKAKFKGSKKKLIITLIITCIAGGGVTFLTTSHSTLVPALENLLTEATDTQHASYVKRSAAITRYMLRGDDPVKTGWTGKNKYKTLTPYMTKRLKQQGIEVEGSGRAKTLKFDGETISADNFHTQFTDNTQFRNAYMKAKRNRVANFFDNAANKFFKRFNLRNIFKSFKQTGDNATDTENFRKTMSDEFDNNSSSAKTIRTSEEEDADGNKVDRNKVEDDSSGKSNSSTAEAESKAKSMIDSAAGKASKIASGTCILLQAGNMISIAVAANQIYQAINYYSSIMENVSKTMAGESTTAAGNQTLNLLATPTTTSISEPGNVKITQDASGNYTSTGSTQTTEITGSMLQANGMQMMMAGAPAQSTTTENYSLESIMNPIAKAIGFSVTEQLTCTAVNATAAGISLVSTIVEAVATGGASLFVDLFWNIGKSIATTIAVSAVLSFVVPTIAKFLFTNVFETVTGIPAGEMLALGASATNTKLGRSGSGQSPATEAQALAYAKINNEVLALEAKTDRLNRSPFDITSKNTFLGSIAYKVLPLTINTQSTSVMSSISTLARTTSSSIASLTHSVSAESTVGSSYMTTFGKCNGLTTIGAKGDIYCNPITVTDTSLVSLDPNDETYNNVIQSQLECVQDETGTCTIKNNSDLAHYISFCANRDSPFGAVDSNILGALQPEALSTTSTVGGGVPILGDILDLINAGYDATNIDWATGKKCVADSSNPEWQNKFRYYQRYVEDDRILEQMGAYEGSKSTVSAYLEEYEATHPLDNSPAGYLSRISGLTKDDAETVIAIAEYYQFLDSYDPETRLAMNGNATNYKTGEEIANIIRSEKPHYNSDQKIEEEPGIIASQHIIYTDIRNRSYAIS